MPLQKPRPPILVGGASEAALRRVARLGDGWHASGMPPSTFRASALAVGNLWKEAKREGDPHLSLRIPILIDGVHQAAVDTALLGTRHVLRGPLTNIVRELRQYQTAGCEHVALEVSYSTYPAILETIDIIAEEIRPPSNSSANADRLHGKAAAGGGGGSGDRLPVPRVSRIPPDRERSSPAARENGSDPPPPARGPAASGAQLLQPLPVELDAVAGRSGAMARPSSMRSGSAM